MRIASARRCMMAGDVLYVILRSAKMPVNGRRSSCCYFLARPVPLVVYDVYVGDVREEQTRILAAQDRARLWFARSRRIVANGKMYKGEPFVLDSNAKPKSTLRRGVEAKNAGIPRTSLFLPV
ncbi:hypothetical protein MRX96_036592 [Rhipicephalus microplus]